MRKLIAVIGFAAVAVSLQLAGVKFIKAHQERIAIGGGCQAGCWRVQVDGVGVHTPNHIDNSYMRAAIKETDALIPLTTSARWRALDPDSARFRDALMRDAK